MPNYMPHIHCYLNDAPLVWSMVITDALIGIAYLFISFTVIRLVQQIKLPFHSIFIAFGLFIFACGGTHFMEIYNLWVPDYWAAVGVKVVTALASVATAIALYLFKDRIITFANSGRESLSTEKKFVEQVKALQESDELFKRTEMFLDSILENIPNMVFVKEAESLKFIRFNRAGEELLGYPRTDLLGKNDFDLFPREQAEFFISKDRAVLSGKHVVDIPEEIIQTKMGPRYLHTRKIPVYGKDLQQPEYLLGISEDITDWKISQEERLKVFGEKIALEERERAATQTAFLAEVTTLLASSFDYHSTLKALADMMTKTHAHWCTVTLITEEQNVERVATTHRDPTKRARMLDFKRDVPILPDSNHPFLQVCQSGKTLHMAIVQDEDLAEISAGNEKHLELLHELGCVSLMVVPIKIRNKIHGAIALISSSEKLYNSQDVAFGEEIASRAAIAIENAKLSEAIQKAVQSRDEFLSIASHELKTPLTALKLQLEFARRLVKPEQNLAPPPEKIAKMLDTSGTQVNRLVLLVDDLLDVSRIEAGKLNFNFEKLDLTSLATDVAERYREHLTASGSSLTLVAGDSIWVWGDRFRLEQVVLNILSNAAKYGANQPIILEVEKIGDVARISCKDRGMGIPSAKIEKIFERFERAVESNHISGLGLGLYIAHEIVAAHDGRIRAESELNKGSTFVIEIPIYKETAS